MTDTDRIDWLEKNWFVLGSDKGPFVYMTIPNVTILRRTVRQAVDEAMRREERYYDGAVSRKA
jgi:hypothetical protein